MTALRIMALSGNHTEFLDELIVRRELSDNFCYYNEHYDSMEECLNGRAGL
ncbi:hypothetical protein [Methanothrix sp.]|nr:hypothetical protein [Methanothrix sp.]